MPKIPTPENLFNELANFALAEDREFREAKTDAVELSRCSSICVGYINDAEEEDDDYTPLYKRKTVWLAAERYQDEDGYTQIGRVAIFLALSQPIDALPDLVKPHMPPDSVEQWENTEPGDLSSRQFVEYGLEKDGDLIEITRNRGFEIYDNEVIIYSVAETDEEYEYKDETTLKEAGTIDAEIEKLWYDEAFTDIISGANVDFYKDFLESRDNEACLAIRSLFQSLRTDRAIPEKYVS